MEPRVIGFIVGTSRGGTTFMNKVLNLHPRVVGFGESAFFGRVWTEPDPATGLLSRADVEEHLRVFRDARWGPNRGEVGTLPEWVGRGQPRWAELINRLAAERGLPGDGATPRQTFDILCHAMAEACGADLVIEKTPHHVGMSDRIEQSYPNTRYVVMLREPYAFLRSYKNQGLQFEESHHNAVQRLYHPIGAALIWRGFARQVSRLMQRAPDRALRVSLDELRADEAGTLRRVQEHLGLDPVDLAGKVKPDNSSMTDGAVELDAGELWWINRLAGKEIKRLGFPYRPVPFSPKVLAHVSRAPLWSVRYLRYMNKTIHGSLFVHVMRYLRPR
jgi:hypothetical protein